MCSLLVHFEQMVVKIFLKLTSSTIVWWNRYSCVVTRDSQSCLCYGTRWTWCILAIWFWTTDHIYILFIRSFASINKVIVRLSFAKIQLIFYPSLFLFDLNNWAYIVTLWNSLHKTIVLTFSFNSSFQIICSLLTIIHLCNTKTYTWYLLLFQK